MQARMMNPAMIVPEAMTALLALNRATEKGAVPAGTIGLVQLRASQINGCSVCVDMHARYLKKSGETDERLLQSGPGVTRRSSLIRNAPRWRSPNPSPGSTIGRTRSPMRYGTPPLDISTNPHSRL